MNQKGAKSAEGSEMKPTMSNQFVSSSAVAALKMVLASGDISFCMAKIVSQDCNVLWTVHKSGRRIPVVAHPEGGLALGWVEDSEIKYRKISPVVAQALIDMHGK